MTDKASDMKTKQDKENPEYCRIMQAINLSTLYSKVLIRPRIETVTIEGHLQNESLLNTKICPLISSGPENPEKDMC